MKVGKIARIGLLAKNKASKIAVNTVGAVIQLKGREVETEQTRQFLATMEYL